LRKYLNKTLKTIKKELTEATNGLNDKVTTIKMNEVLKLIKPIKEGIAIKDETITGILQYFDLIEELKNASK
jgi:hypothetical protein